MSRRKQKWRIQVDTYPAPGTKLSGDRHEVFSHAREGRRAQRWNDYDADRIRVIPNTEIDEIVIDRWFHLEQMNTNDYWMLIGNLTVNVRVAPDGTAKLVTWEEDQ